MIDGCKGFSVGVGGTKYVTVSEAARHLRVSRNTIYEACRENEIRCLKVRSSLRVLIDVDEEYMTVAETAAFLNISPSTVYDACSLSCDYGQLPHIRIRSRIRIPCSRLQQYSQGGGGQTSPTVTVPAQTPYPPSAFISR
ncbi:MAG: helix-turn-helix domain-containing protein [Syntrophomonas sp.]